MDICQTPISESKWLAKELTRLVFEAQRSRMVFENLAPVRKGVFVLNSFIIPFRGGKMWSYSCECITDQAVLPGGILG